MSRPWRGLPRQDAGWIRIGRWWVGWDRGRLVRVPVIVGGMTDPTIDQNVYAIILDDESESASTISLERTIDGDPIGVIGLRDINYTHRTAECYCVIGEKKYWGKGIGTKVHSLLIKWALDELGL